ncbi:hypothetical protein NitYY0826_C0242 [Nitratiruptor sp. YY08-26]|nr:hypothetical protein NitYY0813_C0241 [Nitratiruptor sp. YY08-13]BCD65331.1 hypothetical protein NitYY0826_C0242 [Nitratiruptor sp. YY08-26]
MISLKIVWDVLIDIFDLFFISYSLDTILDFGTILWISIRLGVSASV